MGNRMAVAMGILLATAMNAGCAHRAGSPEVADADYGIPCQTDGAIGTRLATVITCTDGPNIDAANTVRDWQNNHQQNPQR
jgi:hypothetical protein